jgi:gas vesicle protein
MYYDDQGRRFNMLSGLLFGTLLGAGVALLVTPQKRFPDARAVRRTVRRLKRETQEGADSLRGRVVEAAGAALAEAWKHSGAKARRG